MIFWPDGFTAAATVVSAKSVQRGLKGTFVYRVREEKAEVVPVRIGYESGDRVVILEGIAPGDVVVSDGQSRVTPGGRVKIAGAQQSVAKEMR